MDRPGLMRITLAGTVAALLAGLASSLSAAHAQEQIPASSGEVQVMGAPTGTVWLLIRDGYLQGPAFEKFEMRSFEQCEMQGAVYMSSKRLYRTSERRGFECIEGK